MIRKIKCNDDVIILSGKDKGKRGIVKLVFTKNNRAIISGLNLIKKHQRPIPDKNQPGGVIKREASIDLSNIAIFNPILKKSDRVKFKVKNGKKVRVFKSDGNIIK